MQANIRHLENQMITLMETKASQDQSIAGYTETLKRNGERLAFLETEWESTKEKLQYAEQVIVIKF